MTQEPLDEAVQKQEELTEDYRDKYLRLLAEVDNTRKRMLKEKQDMARFTIENVMTELLLPLDNLENALKCTDSLSGEIKNWAQGFSMILGQFKEVLGHHGIVPFSSEGEMFNPEMHYAIESEESEDLAEGTIIKEFVKGYRSKEHIIRPAKVKVAKKAQKDHSSQGEL